MTEIFVKVVNMSISASWLILAVLLLRLLLPKAPKAMCCVLWCLVGLKLLFPFSIESALSLLPSAEVITHDTMYAANPTIESGIPVVNQVVNPILTEHFAPNPGDSVNPLQVVSAVGAFVWIVGVAVLLLHTLISFLRLKRSVGTAVRFRENIYQSESVSSPFILGVVRPHIFIPFSLREEELMCVLAHEKAHLKRGDHLWKPLGFLLLAIHWFNPLVWIGFACLCRDIELACDERVMRQIGTDKKKLYSEVLLNCSISHKMIAACPLAFGEVGVKQRIKNVLSYKKPAFWIVFVSLLACVACAVCFMTEPKAENKESDMENETGNVGVEFKLPEANAIADMNQGQENKSILQSPPTMLLQDSLSSKLDYFEVSAGSYSWQYQDGEMMTGVEASGAVPQNAVKGAKWLQLVSYNKLDYVPYTLHFSMEPNRITVREYDLLELAKMDAEVISETMYEDAFVSIPLRERRIYEVIAEWDEANLEKYGCYGTAYYAFATDNTIKYEEEDEEKERIPANLTLGEQFTEEVNNFDGVTMTMEKYKATEGDVEIHNGRDKEIQFGEYYDIQMLSDGQWYCIKLPEELAYNMVAYVVEPGETRIWQVDWEYAYGQLPAGEYRMVKDVMDYRAPGDFDKYYLATEFEIK